MKLIDLSPEWSDNKTHIKFKCPKCLNVDGGGQLYIPVGKIDPEDKPWTMTGDSFENLTLSPSIDFTHGTKTGTDCNAHFFIRSGEIQII